MKKKKAKTKSKSWNDRARAIMAEAQALASELKDYMRLADDTVPLAHKKSATKALARWQAFVKKGQP